MGNSVSDYCFTSLFASQINRIESQSELESEMQRYLFGNKIEFASFGDCTNDIINEDNNTMTEICSTVSWLLYLIINDFVCTVVHCTNDATVLLLYALNNGVRWESYKFKCWFGDEKFLRLHHSLCDMICNEYIDMITMELLFGNGNGYIIEYEYDCYRNAICLPIMCRG